MTIDSNNGAKAGPREKPEKIADELRALIVSGELSEGDSLGNVPDLVERFGVSRPSMREGLRILETEGLVSVVRGVGGGVVVHEPNQRMTARMAAVILQSRNVPLGDVVDALTILEAISARAIAGRRNRKAIVEELRQLMLQERRSMSPDKLGVLSAEFHARLVSAAGNETISIVVEMLTEVVTRAVAAVGPERDPRHAPDALRIGIRARERLLEMIEAGDGDAAEQHWRAHMKILAKMLAPQAATVVDLTHHD